MHPAPSVILSTTITGLGFGLLFWLGLDTTPPTGWVAFVFWLIAYVLAVGGVLASTTFHLRDPEKTIETLSQWRTSWQSREGVAAVVTLGSMTLYGAVLMLFGYALQPLGYLGAIGAIATVFATSMIYMQMNTVPRWNTGLTPTMFLCFALAGGALLKGYATLALLLIMVAGIVQIMTWMEGDKAVEEAETTPDAPQNLDVSGEASPLETPPTGIKYWLSEPAFETGRQHSQNLRIISFGLSIALPILFLLLPSKLTHFLALLAVISHIAGVLTSRWLFIAEADLGNVESAAAEPNKS